jgi:hypothetical protein
MGLGTGRTVSLAVAPERRGSPGCFLAKGRPDHRNRIYPPCRSSTDSVCLCNASRWTSWHRRSTLKVRSIAYSSAALRLATICVSDRSEIMRVTKSRSVHVTEEVNPFVSYWRHRGTARNGSARRSKPCGPFRCARPERQLACIHGGARFTPWMFSILAAAELITDPLPQTPTRKVPVQFGSRVLMGGLAGAVLGAIGAISGALGGAYARAQLAAKFGNDRPAALVEDAIVRAVLIIAAPK